MSKRASVGGWWCLAALVVSGCEDDREDLPHDASFLDGSLDASPDATPFDGKVDASTECTLDQRYEYRYDGGLVAYHDAFTITADGQLRRVRTPSGAQGVPDAGSSQCTKSLACDGTGVTVSDLIDVLAHADVKAAWGDGSTLYGVDPRPYDGSLLIIERADGKEIRVGDACSGSASCTAIPAGIASLAQALAELAQEQTCSL